MNRVKSVNRLFLVLIFISIVSPFLFGRFLGGLNFYQSSAVSEALFLVPAFFYVLLTGGECLNDLQLQIPRISVLILVVVLSWLLLPLMTWLNLFSMLFAENYIASEMLGLNGAALGKNLFYIAVVPALAEELIFRGFFYHGYRPAGIGKAIVFSGLCFGLLHMNLNQFCYAFVIGMLFALLVEATGSVISSMLAHFIINSNSVIMLAVQSRLEKSLGSGGAGAAAGTLDGASAAEAVSRQELLMVLGMYTFLALICGAMAYGVLQLIIRLSGRKEHMRQVLGAGRGRQRAEGQSEKEEYGRQNAEWQEESNRMREKSIVTPALLLGILCALVYMVVTEFLL